VLINHGDSDLLKEKKSRMGSRKFSQSAAKKEVSQNNIFSHLKPANRKQNTVCLQSAKMSLSEFLRLWVVFSLADKYFKGTVA
jgi:hypothetical protein